MEKSNLSVTGEDLSDDFTKEVLPVTLFISFEAFFGFFGNITILLVYSSRYRQINFRYFVLALAVVDLTSSCTTLPGEVFSQLNWYSYHHAWICKVKSFFNIYTAWGSALILLILAIDRYRKVCHPLDWQIRCPVAFRLCGCCLVISLIVAIPALVLWGKQTFVLETNGNNVTVSVCEKSGEYADTIYPLLYICGVYLVPVSLMIIAAVALNFITALRLFGHHSMKVTDTKHQSMKNVAATTSTSQTSEDAMDAKTETKDCGSHGKQAQRRTGKINYIGNIHVLAITRGDRATTFQGKTAHGGCTAGHSRGLELCEDSSTGNFSYDEEFTDDYTSGNEISENYSNDQNSSAQSKRSSRRSRRSRNVSKFHRKRKTMIMLILTSIFAVTMALYIILTSLVAKPDGILKEMPNSQKAAFFFFWRLYFVNSVVNPILYGFMDPGFRSGFLSYVRISKQSVTSTS